MSTSERSEGWVHRPGPWPQSTETQGYRRGEGGRLGSKGLRGAGRGWGGLPHLRSWETFL